MSAEQTNSQQKEQSCCCAGNIKKEVPLKISFIILVTVAVLIGVAILSI